MANNFDEFPSLRELLAAAAAGDKRAVDETHRRFDKTVFRCINRHLVQKGCHASVEHSRAIINETYFAILTRYHQLKDEDSVNGWINTITLNLVIKHVSGNKGCISQQNYTVQLDPARVAEIKETKSMIVENVLINEAVDYAYKKSFMFGEIVRLHLVEGYTLETVAKMLGQSYGKVRSCYHRNMKGLRKFFKGDSEDNEDDEDEGGDDGDSSYEN